MTPCACSSSREPESSGRPSPRRGFLATLGAIVLGGLAYVIPGVVGLIAFLDPLRRKGQAGQFLRLASLDTLPEDGTPRKFPVILDRMDAWNRFPREPVGAVFLRRITEGKRPAVAAFHVVCPHAGCFIEFDSTQKRFVCPCHNGYFDLGGKRIGNNSPSPRDLDTLEVEIRNGSEVWVKFQNFRTGIPQKVAET